MTAKKKRPKKAKIKVKGKKSKKPFVSTRSADGRFPI